MSIKKHPKTGIWYVHISRKGKTIRRSAGTKNRDEAQELHDKLASELWRESVLGERKQHKFDDAVVIFRAYAKGSKAPSTKLHHATYWMRFFAGRILETIQSYEILSWLPADISDATKNRYLSSIGRIFSLAVSHGLTNHKPKLTKFREKKVHIRFLTKPEFQRFCVHLDTPWMFQLSRFAVLTGMRAGEIFNLRWEHVNFAKCSVSAIDPKSGISRAVPLNAPAIEILKIREKKGYEYCFTRESGRKLTQVDSRMIETACKKAGIARLRFHDLRHTWASWHVQSGTTLSVLRELGGWESVAMVQKYAHLNSDHLQPYAHVTDFNT